MLWIPFTLLAAFTQALRNAQQKQLSREVNALGVTLARFIWALPLAVIYLALLYLIEPAEFYVHVAAHRSATAPECLDIPVRGQMHIVVKQILVLRKKARIARPLVIRPDHGINRIIGGEGFGKAL